MCKPPDFERNPCHFIFGVIFEYPGPPPQSAQIGLLAWPWAKPNPQKTRKYSLALLHFPLKSVVAAVVVAVVVASSSRRLRIQTFTFPKKSARLARAALLLYRVLPNC